MATANIKRRGLNTTQIFIFMQTQKHLTFLLIIVLFFSLPIFVYSQQKMNIMTYNIRNGVGMDDVSDYQRTADVIKKYNPDIVAIQEIDSMTNRSSQRFVIKEIADLSNMNYTFAPAIDYDGGKYGIGILSKEKPLKIYQLPLPGREEQRTFLITEFKDYVFICVHLSLTPEDQETSISIIGKELSKIDKPIFIAGDFNAEPDSKAINLLKDKFDILSPLGATTYPANRPIEAIDYIAINKNQSKKFKVDKAFVLDEPVASDHRPILVELSILDY